MKNSKGFMITILLVIVIAALVIFAALFNLLGKVRQPDNTVSSDESSAASVVSSIPANDEPEIVKISEQVLSIYYDSTLYTKDEKLNQLKEYMTESGYAQVDEMLGLEMNQDVPQWDDVDTKIAVENPDSYYRCVDAETYEVLTVGTLKVSISTDGGANYSDNQSQVLCYTTLKLKNGKWLCDSMKLNNIAKML